MNHIILSVAHAPQSPGCQRYEGDTVFREYDFSRAISLALADRLEADSFSFDFFDIGAESPFYPYDWVKNDKIKKVNKIAKKHPDCLAIELHLQQPSGTCIIHHASSTKGREAAQKIFSPLVEGLGRGAHWYGIFGAPNADYWAGTPQYCPYFISRTIPPALIIELGSIRLGEWWIQHKEEVAGNIADSLKEFK